MSLVGIEAGVAGRGCIYAEGVLGGSMLGTTFFHASTKLESAVGAAGRSVEKHRDLAARRGRPRRVVARRNMAAEVGSLGYRKVGERERERERGSLCNEELAELLR